MKTVLVTGGAGFIGSHLCERLVKDGHRVISLDNYFTGSKENHVSGVEYREGHTKDIEKHISEKIDTIYHLGEYSRVHKSLEEPNLVWNLNIEGTLGILEFWRKNGGKLVYAGSSTKSESAKGADGGEGKNLSPYTWAKSTNSGLVCNYGKWFKLPYSVVYFYSVYGPREREWGNYGTLIETFRQNFLNKKPHSVNAPGTQTRAFTHVLDTVEGIILAGEKGEGDGFNISSKDVCSIIEVAEMFGGGIEMNPQTKASRSSVSDDTSKIESIGWKQKYKLKDYIEEVKKDLSR
jgi:UDP-glucose 4-epimerase